MIKSNRAKCYSELDKLFSSIERLVSNLIMSQTIRDFFSGQFVSFFYSSLISNILDNINKANAREHDLPIEEIADINRSYAKIRQKAKAGLSLSLKQHELIDEAYYKNFKNDLSKQHPDYFQFIDSIEKMIDMNRARRYLKDKQNNIKNIGKPDTDVEAFLLTKGFEIYIRSKNRLPTAAESNKLKKRIFSNKFLDLYAEDVYRNLRKSVNQMQKEQRRRRFRIEERLYTRWKEPLSLLGGLIRFSFQSGAAKKDKLVKSKNSSNKCKHDALIRIHARGIQISREIFVLLNAGYADGANARWRSLHELAGIALFLYETDNDIAGRYLDHHIMKVCREAKEYQTYCKNLGYAPFSMKEMQAMENKCNELKELHGSDFGKQDYNWIPEAKLSDRNFKGLAKHIHIDQLNPYYNMSSNAVHGGSRALFYQLGLADRRQGEILLAGPTIFGLADPLQGTAISLMQISCSLLGLESDVEDRIAMFIMGKYVRDIGPIAVSVQKKIKKDEIARPKRAQSSAIKKP